MLRSVGITPLKQPKSVRFLGVVCLPLLVRIGLETAVIEHITWLGQDRKPISQRATEFGSFDLFAAPGSLPTSRSLSRIAVHKSESPEGNMPLWTTTNLFCSSTTALERQRIVACLIRIRHVE